MNGRSQAVTSGHLVSLVSAISILLLAACSVGTHAMQTSGTITIDSGDHYGWRMDVMIPSQIEAEITALNGSAVDILVMDESNYTRYLDGLDFQYYKDYSVLAASNVSLNLTVLSGTVFIIVDNSELPADPSAANPTKNVQVQYWLGSSFDFSAIPDQGNVWFMYVLVGIAAVMLVVVVVFARRAIRSNRKDRTDLNHKSAEDD